MKKCKVCGAALSGLKGKIRKLFFRQHLSDKDPQLCNRCANKTVADSPQARRARPDKAGEEKYQCPVCKRMIHQAHALEHIKTEEYLMKLISKDHPRWAKEEPVCKECIDYYRKLVEDAEI
ncbi:MAG: hypothetical protein K9L95_03310 [Candidatus Omnitrophica bacterium]|nr:hypothetical protein [Candidatus Omnitrophota bacterium]MCF7878479.1 hypothetical protein [Candidatus Omnitrophota bacterium]MCF7893278.1 hypothetical protein [Candidatus Omnitrophota bacterium]